MVDEVWKSSGKKQCQKKSTCHDVAGPWIPSSHVVSVSSRPTLIQSHPDSRAHPVAVAWCAPSFRHRWWSDSVNCKFSIVRLRGEALSIDFEQWHRTVKPLAQFAVRMIRVGRWSLEQLAAALLLTGRCWPLLLLGVWTEFWLVNLGVLTGKHIKHSLARLFPQRRKFFGLKEHLHASLHSWVSAVAWHTWNKFPFFSQTPETFTLNLFGKHMRNYCRLPIRSTELWFIFWLRLHTSCGAWKYHKVGSPRSGWRISGMSKYSFSLALFSDQVKQVWASYFLPPLWNESAEKGLNIHNGKGKVLSRSQLIWSLKSVIQAVVIKTSVMKHCVEKRTIHKGCLWKFERSSFFEQKIFDLGVLFPFSKTVMFDASQNWIPRIISTSQFEKHTNVPTKVWKGSKEAKKLVENPTFCGWTWLFAVSHTFVCIKNANIFRWRVQRISILCYKMLLSVVYVSQS